MADIKKELNDIKNAVYGREVRGSIHDGIEKINDESENSKQKADEAHDVMESIMTEGFDNAALEANFEQKLDDKIANLQPEWTGFKEDVTTQLAETDNKLNRQPTKNNVLATLIWDDGNMKDYDLVFPYIESKNIKASFALYTNGIGSSNSLGESEIMEMKNAGHEFLSHSVSHPDLTTISKEEKEYELRESKRILEDLGLDIKGFVYPLNRYDGETLELVRKYYDYAFAKDENTPNKPPINQYAMYRVTLEHEHDYVKQFVDKAIEEKSWLVFMAHGMYYDPGHVSYQPEAWANAKQNIEYCLSKGIEFVTTEQGIKEFGNSITIGDYKESEKMFMLSKKGDVISNSIMSVDYNNNINVDTKGSEFKKNAITISEFLNIDEHGFPEDVGGILYTRIFGDRYGFGNQEWLPYGSSIKYERRWFSAGDIWGQWSRIMEVPITTTIIENGDGRIDSTTRVHNFITGRVTIAQYLGTTGADAGFPTNAGTLYTYKYIDGATAYQEWVPVSGTSFYRRGWNTASGGYWRDWIKYDGSVVE